MGMIKTLLLDYCILQHPDDFDAQDRLFDDIVQGRVSVSLKEMKRAVDSRKGQEKPRKMHKFYRSLVRFWSAHRKKVYKCYRSFVRAWLAAPFIGVMLGLSICVMQALWQLNVFTLLAVAIVLGLFLAVYVPLRRLAIWVLRV